MESAADARVARESWSCRRTPEARSIGYTNGWRTQRMVAV